MAIINFNDDYNLLKAIAAISESWEVSISAVIRILHMVPFQCGNSDVDLKYHFMKRSSFHNIKKPLCRIEAFCLLSTDNYYGSRFQSSIGMPRMSLPQTAPEAIDFGV